MGKGKTANRKSNGGLVVPADVYPRYMAMATWTPRSQRGYRGSNNGAKKR